MTAPVVVIGGGFTGLVAAYRLARAGLEPLVLEAGDTVGGKILTQRVGDATVELGPDSFLARERVLVDLCTELGLADDLVSPSGFGAQVWLDDGLRRLPASTYFGIPLDPEDAASFLSSEALAQVVAEEHLPVPHLGGDISVGELVTERFGREVLDEMVDPILAGTRAGDPFEVSAESALPEAWRALEDGCSLTAGLRESRRAERGGPPPFFGVRGGMRRIVDALIGAIGADRIRIGSRARGLRRAHEGYAIDTDGGSVQAAGVVVTVAPAIAAGIFEPIDAHLARGLTHFDAADVAIVTLLFEGTLRLPEGSGLLVPSKRQRTLTGATWYSSKWPHAVPAGTTIIRCFAGRAVADPIPSDDEDLVKRVSDELAEAVGSLPRPVETRVARWPGGLPIYAVGHRKRLRALNERLQALPGIAVAGAAYDGSGLPDCARQAFAAAERVAAELSAGGR